MKMIKIDQMRRSVSLVTLSMLLMILISGCANSTVAQDLTVNVATAGEDSIQTELQLTGVLLPKDLVNISSKASGQILNMPKQVGEKVAKGEVLIELDTKTLEAQLQQAEAGLSAAKAAYASAQNQAALLKISLDQTEKTYLDTKALFETGAVSEGTYTDTTSRYNLAKKQYENAAGPLQNQALAAIENAEASIHTLSVQKENSTIISPIDGVIVSGDIQSGEIVSPGMLLLSIADLSTLKMKGTIAQAYLPYVTVNDKVDFKVDIYPDQIYDAEISKIGPMAVSTGKIFPIEITIPNEDQLMAGLSARFEIEVKGKPHVMIPLNAVVNAEGQSYVYVIKDQVAIKREVVTGLKNDTSVEILSGLEKGEVIAITNTHILQDQMLVKIATE
ncbi:efflux RND transporter periplasmic adaptor subunit [Fusibacter ferrireducens]|uniref:Efflux RND transporter periplasmic adaptor subunit n=1 Tax=Fusibacter ferrireducens TaxID=2785058 RepID=A0ABR9ZYE9_9FIRM|nr:efflux RND transporter periplasmic adaptor subunit [Fusibacter ferrireducens]MBF4694981.1 efflux RND transporter periplasmic adaptor subunit [Fusibacter ferrireducens]